LPVKPFEVRAVKLPGGRFSVRTLMAIVAVIAVSLVVWGCWLSYVYEVKAERFARRQVFHQKWSGALGWTLEDRSRRLDLCRKSLADADSDRKRKDLRDRIMALEAIVAELRAEREGTERQVALFGALALKYRRMARYPFLYAEPDPPLPYPFVPIVWGGETY
jgi:hypothetical protein